MTEAAKAVNQMATAEMRVRVRPFTIPLMMQQRHTPNKHKHGHGNRTCPARILARTSAMTMPTTDASPTQAAWSG